jgi:predicted NAD/FAD-binding protein
MRAFPCLSSVYSAWADRLRSAGVELLLQHEVTLVKRTKDGITVQWQRIDHVDGEGVSRGIGDAGEAGFDEVVFCCDADTCLKLLGKSATWMEKKVLGNVKVSAAIFLLDGLLTANL